MPSTSNEIAPPRSGARPNTFRPLIRLSVSTVETYRANIKDKLGLSSSAELAKAAVESAVSGAV